MSQALAASPALRALAKRLESVALRLQARGRGRLAWRMGRFAAALAGRDAEALHTLGELAVKNGNLSQARAICEELLEKRPGDLIALDVLGQLCLAAGEVESAVRHFARHDSIASGGTLVTRLLRQRHLDETRARQAVPYYVRLRDVLVDTAYWSIMPRAAAPAGASEVYSLDTHGRSLARSPFVRDRVSPDRQHVIASFGEPSVVVEEECIFVGGDENYSHWLFRNLLKLCSLEDEGILDALPWLLNSDLAPWQSQYLDMLGVSVERRLTVERGQVVRCAHLVVPALLTDPRTIRQGVEWIRRRLSTYMTPPDRADALIYVSRRDARLRHVTNEDDLYRHLQPLGFSMVVPGHLTVAEQIAAFSSARVIVCVHGAALTNIVFAPPRAAVVEINSAVLAPMDDFRRMARALGQRMTTVISDRYANPHETVHPNSDYFVDVDEIVRRVEESLRIPPGRGVPPEPLAGDLADGSR